MKHLRRRDRRAGQIPSLMLISCLCSGCPSGGGSTSDERPPPLPGPGSQTLTIEVSGPGQTEPPAGMYEVDANTSQSLRATPDDNARFVRWSGDISGENLGHVVFMDRDKRVVAEFHERGPGFTIARDVVPPGSGAIELDPPGGEYDAGTTVALRAVPEGNCEFQGWTSGLGGQESLQTVVLMIDLTVVAAFECGDGDGIGNGGSSCDPATCDDDLFCNGLETCVAGECRSGNPPCEGQACCDVSDQCIPEGRILSGCTVTASIDAPAEQDAWIFDGIAGQRARIMLSPTDTLNPCLRLFPPGGGPQEAESCIFGAFAVAIDVELAATGQYTILVHANAGASMGGYTLSLQQF